MKKPDTHFLLMLDCPRCHQTVDAQSIACPHCRTPLKAFGHPGIPLHRAGDEEFLCETCLYHKDDTCNFPKRPYARECTLYQKPGMQSAATYRPSFSHRWQSWLKRNASWIVLLGLVAISLLLALSNR